MYPNFRRFIRPILLTLVMVLPASCQLLAESEQSASSNTQSNTRTLPIAGDTVEVTYVYDGDTIEVELNGEKVKVRYIGIDTPERDTPYYAEATKANRDLVQGETVILVKDVSETDRFGRLLRYIYLPDGTFVNEKLIADGYARLITIPPDLKYADYFRELQADARSAEKGLWGALPQSDSNQQSDACPICNRNAYNCRDFNSQSEAQACYAACLEIIGYDVHNLDGGGDGVVCEALP